ncbi:MAG TPA: DUF455 family protein, partial [Guyparkeria sp.]|nr:DUF455 family protein [Guyparkeria sp.]
MTDTLRERAGQALRDHDPVAKAAAARALYEEAMALPDEQLPLPPSSVESVPDPGRPASPELVAPKDVPKRGPASVEGRAAMAHSFAHIEFNA